MKTLELSHEQWILLCDIVKESNKTYPISKIETYKRLQDYNFISDNLKENVSRIDKLPKV